MAAVEDEIAAAVVAELNAGAAAVPSAFSQSFTAEAVEHPRVARTSLETLHVVVTESGYEVTAAARGADHFDYAIAVGIRKNLADLETTSVGPLKDLVQELADYLRARSRTQLPGYPAAGLLRIETTTNKEPQAIDQHSLFVGLLRIVYRVTRAK